MQLRKPKRQAQLCPWSSNVSWAWPNSRGMSIGMSRETFWKCLTFIWKIAALHRPHRHQSLYFFDVWPQSHLQSEPKRAHWKAHRSACRDGMFCRDSLDPEELQYSSQEHFQNSAESPRQNFNRKTTSNQVWSGRYRLCQKKVDTGSLRAPAHLLPLQDTREHSMTFLQWGAER